MIWDIYAGFAMVIIASFVGLLTHRLPFYLGMEEKSFTNKFSDPSVCDHCKTYLVWWQLIPILGYLISLGKCPKCKNKIPVKYTLFEIFSGVCGFYYTYTYHYSIYSIMALSLIIMTYIISIIDIKYYYTHDILLIIVFLLALFPSPLIHIYYYKFINFFIYFILFFIVGLITNQLIDKEKHKENLEENGMFTSVAFADSLFAGICGMFIGLKDFPEYLMGVFAISILFIIYTAIVKKLKEGDNLGIPMLFPMSLTLLIIYMGYMPFKV